MNHVRVETVQASDRDWVGSFIKSRWGSDIVVGKGRVFRPAELDGLVAFKGERRVGLLTYKIVDRRCEIVTIDSSNENQGVGTALMAAVKEKAVTMGCSRVWLITTNDNLNALGFYQKRGFRLVALYPKAVDASRKMKPQIPLTAENGIPIRDELELEFDLTKRG